MGLFLLSIIMINQILLKITKLSISGVLFIMAGYFVFPMVVMILHYTVGGMPLDLVNRIAISSTLMSQVISTTIFLIPGIWFLKKAVK